MQTSTQTHRHGHHSTQLPYPGRSNNSPALYLRRVNDKSQFIVARLPTGTSVGQCMHLSEARSRQSRYFVVTRISGILMIVVHPGSKVVLNAYSRSIARY